MGSRDSVYVKPTKGCAIERDFINTYFQTKYMQDITLEHVEEAYTTENWLVRIYRVKKPANRNGVKYTERLDFYLKLFVGRSN